MGIGLLVSALLQLKFPAFSAFGDTKPPLLLAVVLYYALQRNRTVMLIAAVLAGFIQDALSPVPLGVSACCFCLAGWTVSRYRKVVLTDSRITQAFFGLAMSAAVTLLLYVLLLTLGRTGIPLRWALLKTVWTGAFGMVCAPFVSFLLGGLDRHVGNIVPAAEVEEDASEFE